MSDPQPPPHPPELQGLSPAELLARGIQSEPRGGGPWQPPSPEELSRLLPQYRIESLLGRGGMGAVYRGLQEALDRPVAIKLLPAEVAADSDFVARFRREAKTLAKLQHPGIVNVFDFGQTSEGHLYFVMEFVDGTDLQRVLKGPGLNTAQALELIAQICDALHYAHRQGVIHRDIKPANILITKDGRAKVADFGLARPTAEDASVITSTPQVMGTPAYMAPEQHYGQADERSDIFALGVMLYEMLTGQRPRGATEPPSRKVQIDVRLDEVVLKALQLEPDRRYQQAGEMKSDVDSIRTTPPPGIAKRRKAKLHRRLAFAACALALIAALSFAVWKVRALAASKASLAELRAATKEQPFVNSLGMKFVPVPITGGPTDGKKVLFSVWDTRVQDYAAYARVNKVDGAWTTQEWDGVMVSREPEYPVVGVSWEDAKAFCKWLTEKESAEGKLPKGMGYRLPTDEEWSRAVGLANETGATPAEKNEKNGVDFPWGLGYPPKGKVGNYADEAYYATFTKQRDQDTWIKGYNDGYVTTSPVGSFAPNAYGLCDMGGNVWQWCEDWFDLDQKERVIHGAAWHHDQRSFLLSSSRAKNAPGLRNPFGGFRCVLAAVTSAPPAAAAPVRPASITPTKATKDQPFVNSLGMKFVPVPITGGATGGQRVLFSIWETRVQDYEVFAKETKREWPKPDFAQGPTHPAVNVSWEDAQAFCTWLTEREHKAGKLAANERYRLPSDHEWSCAVGIGEREDAAKLPLEKHQKISDAFPWGNQWPPPKGAGNYDPSLRVDEFINASPVGSFAANRFGLYDMGGNVWQWCEDWIDQMQKDRVLRGASAGAHDRDYMLASHRSGDASGGRHDGRGFRCVLATSAR